MGYKCGNCMIDFSCKRELIEHMIDKHNSPFVEGELSEASDKILAEKENGSPIAAKLKEKVKSDRVI